MGGLGRSRSLLLVGLSLFIRAAYLVITARHALRDAGGHVEDFVLPWNVILLVVLASVTCLLGALKSNGGLKPIHVEQGRTVSWDRMNERFNFRLYSTRGACAASLIERFVTPPPPLF
ncbi:membrane magnesium transporter [Cystoisospora suis]|uniref:Membrane magnesium transporter n=1 Tax=Cystoisospora suis TaxID=483139 RepID=A0A2C6L321_9APIC|nr:membrane magnesium transporter [Cystoisospora suis]